MSTPLHLVKNIGPVTLAEFEAMGIQTIEQIQKIGFERFCRKYVSFFPERLNANAFLGIICSIEGTVWTKATENQRAKAHSLVAEMRKELSLPLPKRKKSSKLRRP